MTAPSPQLAAPPPPGNPRKTWSEEAWQPPICLLDDAEDRARELEDRPDDVERLLPRIDKKDGWRGGLNQQLRRVAKRLRARRLAGRQREVLRCIVPFRASKGRGVDPGVSYSQEAGELRVALNGW